MEFSMRKRFDSAISRHQWTSLASLMLILLFAGAADGLMDKLGLMWFLIVGAVVMGAAWALERMGNSEKAKPASGCSRPESGEGLEKSNQNTSLF